MENLPSAITALTIWRPQAKEEEAAAAEKQAAAVAAAAAAAAVAATEQTAAAEEKKPPIRQEILFTGSGANSTYTLTLQHASHHSNPTRIAYLSSIFVAFHPLQLSLLLSENKHDRLLASAESSEEKKATQEFMGEFGKVLRKLAAFKDKMRDLEWAEAVVVSAGMMM
ncbi:MAG: hypothetical protein LQ350_005485 [Teloschistes chrysophthalmus]|nr:MAG: hypothetical protein LQ350_005485 [Niorma chrysophthalma]